MVAVTFSTFLGLLLVTLAAGVNFKDCGSKLGSVKFVDIQPRPVGSCLFHKGTNANMTMTFTTDEAISTLTASARGQVLGSWIPFKLPESNGCNLGISCPTTAGGENTMSVSIPIHRAYPKIRVNVALELKNSKGASVVCITFPGEIC